MPITCPYCSREFNSDQVPPRHKGNCPGWVATLTAETTPCLCGYRAPSSNKMKDHYRECPVWKARDKAAVMRERVKATSLERYGVEDPTQAPEVVAARKATNAARYGAENPFSKKALTYQKVQESLDGKRPVLKGSDNPFSRPDVKEKIRASMELKYGAPTPQEVPSIRAATRATNLARYGGELLGSPELRAKAEATNLERYGFTEPSRNLEVVERIRQTNLVRYGVEWTNQDPEVRREQLETMTARYGSHYFASEEGKREVRAALVERYGVEFPGAIEDHWEKAVATFRERYGVDHPLHLEQFRAKQRATNEKKYGNIYPGISPKGPNGLERKIGEMNQFLVFTGDGGFWRWCPLLKGHKNPDFIFPGPDPLKPKKGVTKVVEAFGNFWHSRMFTGKAPFDHEQELIDAYADIGIACLVVWESEVKKDPESVRARLAAFLGTEPATPCIPT